MSATKTASVNARIDQNVKQQAEAILSQIGLPRSVAIDLFYRQIINHNGIPFALTAPSSKVQARDAMTDIEFDRMMAAGHIQSLTEAGFDAEDFFEELEKGL